MSKRYYLCDVVGDGTPENPFRSCASDYTVAVASAIKDGVAFSAVTTENHGQLIADNRINALPDFPLDGKINAMQGAAKTQMQTDVAARGLDISAISSADGYRDVIRAIGLQLSPHFNENNFGI